MTQSSDVSTHEHLNKDQVKAIVDNDELIHRATMLISAAADSTRFKILAALTVGDMCVADLVELCGVSQSAISHQLRLLRDRDLVKATRDGKFVIYSLNDSHVHVLITTALTHVEHLSKGLNYE